MASVVFSTIGQAVGGPLGGAVGALVGGTFDRAFSGRGKAADARDLFVQSSAYGDIIPRIYGRVRHAGILIWALPMEPGLARKGGGGQRGYFASFAIALSSGPLRSVGRIWADGREFRDAEGRFDEPVTMRVHLGGAGQAADPLIAAAEGLDRAPAYRGLAYAVFENLSLASFGNRLPNLSFELVADTGPAARDWLLDLTRHGRCQVDSLPDPDPLGYIARQRNWRDDAERLGQWVGAKLSYREEALRLGGQPRLAALEPTDVCAAPGDERASFAPVHTVALDRRPAAVGAAYLDADRDYQRGFQMESRQRAGRDQTFEAPVVATASAARRVAGRMLRDAEAGTETVELVLPFRWLGLTVGDTVCVAGISGTWRIVRREIEGMLVRVQCEAVAAGRDVPWTSDPGRNLPAPLMRTPPTRIFALEPPLDPGRPAESAQLWVAATGGVGWRGATVTSTKGDGDEQLLGTASGEGWFGTLLQPAAPGPRDIWDAATEIVVSVDGEAAGPQSRSEASVLAGANLVLVGDELMQFRTAEALGDGHYRLSGLLRGRNASRIPAEGHPVGTSICVLDQGNILRLPVEPDDAGGTIALTAEGRGDPPGGSRLALTLTAAGHAPLGPCHLEARRLPGGDLELRWTSRHREQVSWNAPPPGSSFGQHYECRISCQAITLSRTAAGERLMLSLDEQVAAFGAALGSFRLRVLAVGTGPEWLRGSEEVALEAWSVEEEFAP
ncbi:MAG: phage tail protein [Thermaurantiacus sp.]